MPHLIFLSLITEADFSHDFLIAFSHLWIVFKVNVKILIRSPKFISLFTFCIWGLHIQRRTFLMLMMSFRINNLICNGISNLENC